MSTLTKPSEFVRRSLRLAVATSAICVAGVAVMSAQAPAAPAQGQVTEPLVDFNAYVPASTPFAVASDSSSSSADTPTEASIVTVDPLHLSAMQYGGRQRYGKPRYRGGNTNPDGSNKWMFYAGAGLAQPSGNTWKYFTPSWAFQVGGGRQFSRHFAVPIEFDYDHFGLSKQTISNQSFIYTGDDYNAADNGIDASMHVWSFSVDPTFTLLGGTDKDGLGAYVLGNVGFYHKVTDFTAPQLEEYCDYYYGCQPIEVQGIFDHYTSNAPGFGGGLGFTYKISHFSGERLYAEARYIFVDNSQRTGYTVTEAQNGVIYTGNNFFPANSNRTTYFPIKFGIRF